ncbi:alanine racemase [Hoeflea marina]|nr:alanine racemase [Hoeflea marina]
MPAAATTRLAIDLGALAANWRQMAARSGRARCGAAVKADGYGTGMIPVAGRLEREGCRDFFVADANEGAALRRALPEARIHVLNGAFDGAMALLVAHDLIPVLNSMHQVALWRSAGAGRACALHVDTGMNRLGVTPAEAAGLAADPSFRPVLVMSHFACADTPAHPLNAAQIAAFAAARAHFPQAEASLANSAGIHLGADALFDLTRPGIALYGGESVNDTPNPMAVVATLKTRVLVLREARAGDSVSYGATARLGRDSRIAVCGIGYADGFHRSGSGSGVPLRGTGLPGAHGIIAGERVPVLGRVTMDLTMFDVTDLAPGAVEPGSWIELFGPAIALDDAARAAGTIGYELLTAMGRRSAREYRD